MSEITIPIQKKYLFFPIGGNVPLQKVYFSCGEEGYDLDLRLTERADYYTWMDAEAFKGREVRFSSVCPQRLLDGIWQGDSLPADVYKEALRPRLHYTPMRGWVNDPNGLVWSAGRYHLFYQHNPYDVRWGNMHWGHAVSFDLIRWEEKGEALYPDGSGTMFSGCGVADTGNVSGLGSKEAPPLLLYYTAAGGANAVSEGKTYTVCLAYSLDGGETFVKYAGNPVLPNLVYGNRDPKVFWHEGSRRWCMVLFLYAHKFAFFTSEDLLHWQYASEGDFPPLNECPDLFPVEGTDKWALLAGSGYWGDDTVGLYYIGKFDGARFSAESGPYPIDFGRGFYSLQTFDGDPSGRRVLMGWRTRNFHLPERHGMPFNGEFSLPTRIFPFTAPDGGLRLARYPVEEFFSLAAAREQEFCADVIDASLVDKELFSFEGDVVSVAFEGTFTGAAIAEFDLGGEKVFYHSETETLQAFGCCVKVPLEEGRLTLLFIRDRQSLEIYAQGGKYPVCAYAEFVGKANRAVIYRGAVSGARTVCRLLRGIRLRQRRARELIGG